MTKVEKILNTTTKLFIRDGIRKITMDEIAANSNVSKVTIYKYFADKDSLYYEVGRHIFLSYTGQLNSLAASEDTLSNRLYAFMRIVGDFTLSGQFALCGELAKLNPAIEDEYDLYVQTYKRALLALIDTGIVSGLIKNWLDRDIVYHYIDMGVVYFQQCPEYRHKILDGSGFQKQFMHLLIRNIFADGTLLLPDEW